MVEGRLLLSVAASAGMLAIGGSGCQFGSLVAGDTEVAVAPAEPVTVGDGRHFGYIRSMERSARGVTLAFDVAAFLTGRAAQQAARAEGAIAPGEPVSNDYYVLNRNRHTQRLPVAPKATVSVVQCPTSCREGQRGTLAGLVTSFADPNAGTYADRYRGPRSQYWLTVRGGRVVAIDEQYVP